MRQLFSQIESLYEAEGMALLRYIRRCGGGSSSEDLLQETFVQLLKQPEKLHDVRSPRAWLYGIARHRVLGFIRREVKTVELTVDPPSAVPAEDERIRLLKAAVEALPKQQREILELRLDAELSYQEIAEALAVPVGTVRSRLHHAVRNLRSALTGEEIQYGCDNP